MRVAIKVVVNTTHKTCVVMFYNNYVNNKSRIILAIKSITSRKLSIFYYLVIGCMMMVSIESFFTSLNYKFK